MGGLPRPPRPGAARLSVRWIEALEEASPGGGLAWIVAPGTPRPPPPAPRPEDIAHAARRRDPARRAATLERRLMLRALAARALGVRTEAVWVEQSPGGPPRVIAPCPLAAAAAARGGWTLLAVSPSPVGADVERVEPGAHRPLDLLHPELAARLASADDAAFVQAWASVEAHLKLGGGGVAGLGHVRLNGARAWSGAAASSIVTVWRGDRVFAVATPAMEPA